MAVDVSGFGTAITIISAPTIPQGYELTAFTDDIDVMEIPTMNVVDFSMGVNGDLILNRRPVPIEVTVGVIPNSDDDLILEGLLNANRVAKNKASVKDDITMIIHYPDERGDVILSYGTIVGGDCFTTITSQGRLKSKQYHFVFEMRAD